MGQEKKSVEKFNPKEPVNAKKVMQEQDAEMQAQKYNKYVEERTPKPDLLKDMFNAFWVGGLICTVGQFFTNFYMGRGASEEDAASFTVISLVLLSVLCTGFNFYQKITKLGGAGSLVPITGFANSVAAPAIEFQKDVSVIIGTRSKKPRKIKGFR